MAHTPADDTTTTGSTPTPTVERPVDGLVSDAVVSAVADAIDSEPTAIDPLYDAIDPEALDALFRTDGLGADGTPSRLEFSYGGCEVTVTGDGIVRVSRPR